MGPKATQRCHSDLDSHSPVSGFFQEFFVATEKTVILLLLASVFDSASRPRKPVKVTLLRYIVFISLSAPFFIGAPESKWNRSQERSGESKCFVGGAKRALFRRLKSLMLGMGEPTKQNGEERRARLGVKPSSAAVPEENVQQEKMTNVSQADPGPPRRCRRDSQQQWCDLSPGNGRFVRGELGPCCVRGSCRVTGIAWMIAT